MSSVEAMSQVRGMVAEILGDDDSGHDMGHIDRVYAIGTRLAGNLSEPVDTETVSLGLLLHDVDDYKIVGREQAAELTNATEIMRSVGVDPETQVTVRGIIATMGYSKALRGVRPATLEGQIVSDADMCDAIGASGVVRALMYAVSDKGSGVVFDREVWPIVDITAEQYNGNGTSHTTDSFVNHFFEKLLKLKNMMLTEPGRQEAKVRHQYMVDFLHTYFKDENAPEWSAFLDDYLNREDG